MSIVRRLKLSRFLRKYYDRIYAKYLIKSLKKSIKAFLKSKGCDASEMEVRRVMLSVYYFVGQWRELLDKIVKNKEL